MTDVSTNEDLLVLKAHVKGHVRGQSYVRPYERGGNGPSHPEATDRRFNRMRPSIAPRKRHQAG